MELLKLNQFAVGAHIQYYLLQCLTVYAKGFSECKHSTDTSNNWIGNLPVFFMSRIIIKKTDKKE